MSQNSSKPVDLFGVAKPAPTHETSSPMKSTAQSGTYTAADIEVLEGLEPVRRRPGMYIGGTDERALHHLFAEVLDNSMDEAVAGHASWIEIELEESGFLVVGDNGRGIPIDPHPKFPNKSALEVIMCTLHAGGKFDSNVYETSGGLHGVGISVVNALSSLLEVEVARGQMLYKQDFIRGIAQGGLQTIGKAPNRRGTRVRFLPDTQIFGDTAKFDPKRLFSMAKAKAHLFAGVEVRWKCAACWIKSPDVPEKAVLKFPGGLLDDLSETVGKSIRVTTEFFAGKTAKTSGHGAVEWAISWVVDMDGLTRSYCNTIPTGDGGTHEMGLRVALLRGLRGYADLVGNKRFSAVTAEDVMQGCVALLSVFIREPEFVGQTKDKLATPEASRIVEGAIKDAFDHWIATHTSEAAKLLDWAIERADERLRRRAEKDVARKTAVKKLRLPGKLADCSQTGSLNSEIFIVEGDSAGGSAKQARDRATQAVLPLRGKILNVASATKDKTTSSQQIADLALALGCGVGKYYSDEALRYEKVIIMTDADVDGAHIATLLITFFYQEMPKLIENGHLFLAIPPLYRMTYGGKTSYARDDAHKDELMKTVFSGKKNVDIGRFKGLGEMMPQQLKETTMDRSKRTLLRVDMDLARKAETADVVDRLMGTKPEARFQFITERAEFAKELDI